MNCRCLKREWKRVQKKFLTDVICKEEIEAEVSRVLIGVTSKVMEIGAVLNCLLILKKL